MWRLFALLMVASLSAGQTMAQIGPPSYPPDVSHPVASGTYTPTVTFQNNATVSFVSPFMYTRVGNVVTVMGSITIAVTNSASSASARLSIPVPSTFANGTQLNGFGPSVLSPPGAGTVSMHPFTSDGTASLTIWSIDTASHDYGVTFMYTVQ